MWFSWPWNPFLRRIGHQTLTGYVFQSYMLIYRYSDDCGRKRDILTHKTERGETHHFSVLVCNYKPINMAHSQTVLSFSRKVPIWHISWDIDYSNRNIKYLDVFRSSLKQILDDISCHARNISFHTFSTP